MRRALPVLAVLVLLAPLANAAPSPGARAPITVDATVTDVDVAAVGGRFAASNADPGNLANPDVPVWHLWNSDGSVRQDGPADPTGCKALPPTDDCDTDAVAVAVSGDGRRVAAVAAVGNGESVLVITTDNGVETRVNMGDGILNYRATHLAMNEDGSRIVVGGRTSALPTAQGRINVFSSSGAHQFRAEFESAVQALDIAPQGETVVVAAGGHHRVYSPGSLASNSQVAGSALDVQIAGNAGGWSLAGYDSGYFALFADQTPTVQQYRRRDATEAVTAVAIRQDGTAFAVGNQAGSLWLYRLDTAAVDPVTLLGTASALGAVGDLAFSGDGRYLAAKTGGSIRLFHTAEGKLAELWRDDRSGLLNAVAIDGRGEHVVAATGASVLVYDAIHQVSLVFPAVTQGPGTQADHTLTVRNDGNRAERVTLTAAPPTGVQVTLDPSEVTVAAGATQSVKMTVSVPATRAPGSLAIPLTARLNGGTDGTSTHSATLSVPTVRDVRFAVDGSDSRAAQPGDFATFPIHVTNAGNVPETLQLSLSGAPDGWSAEVEPTSLELAPGQMAVVNASLGAPAGAAELSQARASLRRGNDATGVSLTATVGAEFGVRLNAPPGTVIPVGTSGLVDLVVTNEGNAPDSFVVKVGALPAGWQGGFLNGLAEQRIDDLEAGQSTTVQLGLRPPAGAASTVPVQITVSAASVADPGKTASRPVLVTASDPATNTTTQTEDGGGGNGIPGPALPLVVLLLAVLAVAVRRRLL